MLDRALDRHLRGLEVFGRELRRRQGLTPGAGESKPAPGNTAPPGEETVGVRFFDMVELVLQTLGPVPCFLVAPIQSVYRFAKVRAREIVPREDIRHDPQ